MQHKLSLFIELRIWVLFLLSSGALLLSPLNGFSGGLPRLSGLALHLDAGDSSSLSLSEEGKILEWRDTYDESLVFMPPGEAPRLKPDAVNGLPAIHFSGNAFLISLTAAANITNDIAGLTVFVVAAGEGEGSQNFLRIGGGNAVSAARFMLGRRSTDFRLVTRRVDGGDIQSVSGGRFVAEEWTVVSGLADFSRARASLFINGEKVADREESIEGGNTSASDSLMFRIGRDHNDQFWQGDVAEILIFNRPLNDEERAEVEEYLFHKYDIPAAISFDEEAGRGAAGYFRLNPGNLPNEGILFVNGELRHGASPPMA